MDYETIRKCWLTDSDSTHESLLDSLRMDTTPLFKQRTGIAITYQEAHDELLKAYDRGTGAQTGLSSVEMSSYEDPIATSLYKLRFKQYLDFNILKYTGLSYKEWLDQPRYLLEMQLQEIRPIIKKEDDKTEELLDSLETDAGKK